MSETGRAAGCRVGQVGAGEGRGQLECIGHLWQNSPSFWQLVFSCEGFLLIRWKTP